ncbi:MAG: hypothetical protein V5A56_13465 [Halolamina sp.]
MSTNTNQADVAGASSQETETGLDQNIAATLAYVLGPLSGIVMFLVESENDHIRFHGAQSIVVFGGLFVASIALSFIQIIAGFSDILQLLLGAILSLLGLVLWLGGVILWVYLIVRTYQGKDPQIPVAAGIAEDLV